MFNSSFTMNQVHADGILCGQALRKMLGAVSGPVLTAGAAETDLQMRETTLKETLHVRIDQRIDAVQEAEDFTVLLQEIDHGLVQTGQLLEPLILPRIMH